MSNDNVLIKTSVRIDKYRNDEIIDWVNGSFRTDLERSAAFAMFAHVCNEYPEAGKVLRGDLVDSSVTEG